MKVDMREIAVLRDVKAYRHCSGIALAHFKVHIAHRGIKRAGIRIGHRIVGGHRARSCGPRLVQMEPGWHVPWPSASKIEHVVGTVLISRRVTRQYKYRPRRTIANNPHRGPDINRARDAIASRWHKNDTLITGRLRAINRCLQGRTVVRLPVGTHMEVLRREVDAARIIDTRSKHRLRMRRHHGSKQPQAKQQMTYLQHKTST